MDDDYSGHRVINKTVRTACIPASYPSSPQKPIMDWDWRFGLKDLACGSELSFARPSAATSIFPGANVKTVASNVPRFESNGMPLEGSATNKVTCAKSNPQDLTNITNSGDAAAVLSVVNDATELATAGLSEFGPNVYKFDNSTGTTAAYLYSSGDAGNTNKHSFSVYARNVGLCWLSDLYNGGRSGVSFDSSAGYRRVKWENVSTVPQSGWGILAEPGSVIYFTLPQLEEGPVCTSPIPGGTGTITRASEGSDTSNNGLTMPLTQAMIDSLSSGGSGTLIQTVYLTWPSSMVPDNTVIPICTPSDSGLRGLHIHRSSEGTFYPGRLSDGVNIVTSKASERMPGSYITIVQWSAITLQMRIGIYDPATGILTWGNYATYRGFFPISTTGGQRMRWFYGGGSFNINLISTQWFNCILSDDDMLFYTKKFGCAL